MSLEKFGWNEFFAAQPAAGVPARIAAASREHFMVWTAAGEMEATLSGRLRYSGGDWPAVGDWVLLRGDAPVIESVLERRTKLVRKQPGKEVREQVLAANVDVLFIVSGLDGDYNPRRLERYLVLAAESGARPVVLLNKSDLAETIGFHVESLVRDTRALCGAALRDDGAPVDGSWRTPVLALSAISGEGVERLPGLLAPGETAALIGSSGAGKSTILNRLLGEERQRTLAVRDGDQRGRHTTTARELFLMPGGWLLMDLPGLRELQLWADPERVDQGFEEIRELAMGCRFRDCSHASEPGCAVRAADLDAGRMENYQKLKKELKFLERKDRSAAGEGRAWQVEGDRARNAPSPQALARMALNTHDAPGRMVSAQRSANAH